MNRPIVSVIMPVFNSEKYLKESISSIINQTFKNFEFIIIDDKSTDSSLKIIKKYAQLDKRIKIIKNELNLGISRSLNKGLKLAKGKYIARMDADDISFKNRIKVQFDYLEKNTNIFLVGTSFRYIDESGKNLFLQIDDYSPEYIIKYFIKKSLIHHPTVMFRNIGNIYYRKKFTYAEDRDLWGRFITENKKLTVIPIALLKYRLHNSSITVQKAKKQKLFVEEVLKMYIERSKRYPESYNKFDPNKILSLPESPEIKVKSYIDLWKIKYYFKNYKNKKEFRKKFLNYLRLNGFFSWKPGFFYYLISFMPTKIINYFIKIVYPKNIY